MDYSSELMDVFSPGCQTEQEYINNQLYHWIPEVLGPTAVIFQHNNQHILVV